MNLVRGILSHVDVLEVRYRDAEHFDLRWIPFRFRGGVPVAGEPVAVDSLPERKKELARSPLLMLVRGYGVIARPADTSAPLVAQVTSDPDKFMWNYCGERTSLVFVRREQLSPLMKQLEESSLAACVTECVGSGTGEETADAVARFGRRCLTFKALLSPHACGSSLALAFCRRIRLPLLSLVFIVLVANTFVGTNLRERFQGQHARLEGLKKSVRREDGNSQLNRRMMARVNRSLPYRYAWLCDRVAALVPEGVTLTSLSVEPVLKALEEGKIPVQAERTMLVCGEASAPEEVSRFASSLGREDFGGGLRLASLDQDRERGVAVFRIEVAL